MEATISLFKIGTSFASACKNYLLIKEVENIKNDISLIKGSFIQNALNFVEKASICENDNNIRFFVESAYSNFSQSVLLFEDTPDKFVNVSCSVGMTESFADSVKYAGNNTFGQLYNGLVDRVKNKITESDKLKAEQYEKEFRILEMSYLGKAICEYHMDEFSQCIESVDKIIGIITNPYISMIQNVVRLLGEFYSGAFLYKTLFIPIELCMDYFSIQNTIAKKKGISTDNLRNRNKVIKILVQNQLSQDLLYRIEQRIDE